MGRECRRVPPDWEHPRDNKGHYVPLYDEDFDSAAAKWKEQFARWEAGEEFWENDLPPDRESYRARKWTAEEATHFQMYETCSEGTPISPVCASPEEVARWCADNGASAFGNETASYEGWLRVAQGGYAPTMILIGDKIISGVDGLDKR